MKVAITLILANLYFAQLSNAVPMPQQSSEAGSWLTTSIPLKQSLKPGDPTSPPRIPPTFPSIDQSLMITGALLEDPLITETMTMIRSTIPANLLNIPTSVYVSGSTVNYRGDATANCYWPANQCMRTADGNGYVSDTFTCRGANQWGITYDDGPTSNIVEGKHTSDSTEISDSLTALDVHGTYFVTGSNVLQNPDSLVYLDKAGHQIGIHTWTHHPLTSLTNEQIVAEIKYTEAVIFRTIGKVPTYMRPPYGDVDDRVRAVVNAMGYHVALWNQDSQDANGAQTPAYRNTVLTTIQSWFGATTSFVSLEHDINTFTSSIAVEALQRFRNSGSTLKIVTMAECNGHIPYSFGGNSTTTTTTATTATTTTTTTTTKSPTQSANIDVGIGVKAAASKIVGYNWFVTATLIGGMLMIVI